MRHKPFAIPSDARPPLPAADPAPATRAALGGGTPLRLAAAMRALSIPLIRRIAFDPRGSGDESAFARSLVELSVATAGEGFA